MAAERSIGHAFVLAGLIVAADMATKAAIVALLAFGAQQPWLPVLNIVHVLNRGAAFSFLHDAGGWQRAFFIAIAVAASSFLFVMIRRPDTTAAQRIGFGLILGGALGNMIDRIIRGAVVDWIDVHWGPHHWPAFNVADIGITIGAALLVLQEAIGWKKQRDARTNAGR